MNIAVCIITVGKEVVEKHIYQMKGLIGYIQYDDDANIFLCIEFCINYVVYGNNTYVREMYCCICL